MPLGLAETTTSFRPMQRMGTSNSLITWTLRQFSLNKASPTALLSMASVRVFQVPRSFQVPEKRMTSIFGSCSTTA